MFKLFLKKKPQILYYYPTKFHGLIDLKNYGKPVNNEKGGRNEKGNRNEKA